MDADQCVQVIRDLDKAAREASAQVAVMRRKFDGLANEEDPGQSWGGLFDGRPADDYAVHLVRATRRGTPGPALCGIDRFADDSPGWSAGGGLTGPGITHRPCRGCASAAREQFPGLPVTGSVGAREMAAELNVEVVRNGW